MDFILDIKQWFCNHMDCRSTLVDAHQVLLQDDAAKMKYYALWNWDEGAWRTLHSYYHTLGKAELESFLETYMRRYYDAFEYWHTRNPSAAVVALCRELNA